MSKTLRLLFRDMENTLRAVSIPDPVETPGEQDIVNIMDHLINADLIKPNEGSLISKVRAEVVERTVDEVYEA